MLKAFSLQPYEMKLVGEHDALAQRLLAQYGELAEQMKDIEARLAGHRQAQRLLVRSVAARCEVPDNITRAYIDGNNLMVELPPEQTMPPGANLPASPLPMQRVNGQEATAD